MTVNNQRWRYRWHAGAGPSALHTCLLHSPPFSILLNLHKHSCVDNCVLDAGPRSQHHNPSGSDFQRDQSAVTPHGSSVSGNRGIDGEVQPFVREPGSISEWRQGVDCPKFLVSQKRVESSGVTLGFHDLRLDPSNDLDVPYYHDGKLEVHKMTGKFSREWFFWVHQ